MWSPVAALKKSFRRSEATNTTGDSNLPPPALLSEEDLVEEANSNSNNNRSGDNAGVIWSPVAAFKRSFMKSPSARAGSLLPPPALLDEDDIPESNNNSYTGDVGNTTNGDDVISPSESSNKEQSGDHQRPAEVSPNGGTHHTTTTTTTTTTTKNPMDNSHDNSEHLDDSNSSSYEGEDDDDKATEPSGFNTRLSGFNTRLLADDDLGDVDYDDDEDEEEEEYNDSGNGDDEFDFAGQSDEELIDRAFFGVDVSDSEDGDEYFNEWYLRDDEEGFLAPILFEDGMNSDECDLYYITLEEDKVSADSPSPYSTLARRSLPTQFRSAAPLRPLEEEEADELPSCLREPKSRPIQNEMVPIRRRSFGGLPALLEMPEFYRPHSCPDLSALHAPHLQPKVNFDTEVQVVTVFAASDFPRKIRSNLWLTRKEIRASRKEASYERRKERRQREKDHAAGRGTF
ncbi:MAG: hypothetical protein SGBAC_004703 [Bacillariaceae sp.]